MWNKGAKIPAPGQWGTEGAAENHGRMASGPCRSPRQQPKERIYQAGQSGPWAAQMLPNQSEERRVDWARKAYDAEMAKKS